jgi:hypothetical protein
VVGVSYTQSDVLGDFGAFKSTGAGQTMGLNYNHYFAPSGGYRSNLNLGLDDKQFDVTQINGIALVGQMVRRSRPLTLGYSAGSRPYDGWGYSADLVMVRLVQATVGRLPGEDPRYHNTVGGTAWWTTTPSRVVVVGRAWSVSMAQIH